MGETKLNLLQLQQTAYTRAFQQPVTAQIIDSFSIKLQVTRQNMAKFKAKELDTDVPNMGKFLVANDRKIAPYLQFLETQAVAINISPNSGAKQQNDYRRFLIQTNSQLRELTSHIDGLLDEMATAQAQAE